MSEPAFEGPDELDADLLEENDSDTQPCPHCGADIYADAERCNVCGEWILRRGGNHPHRLWYILLALAGVIAFVLLYVL